eukprot:TRINITY_DN9852_c0_g1_i4.p1 TRINITY_DN9852_c0_g1~~TRINITY_DN9852_c0_g1_i4.p1  ORF type:complete len:371 (+),score=79.50 TRINITY_DN9852_c0_g1_i4:93-1205(+)
MAAIYGLEYSTKALCARAVDDINDDADILNFLVGTCTVRHENQLHSVLFNDETEEISSHIYSYEQGSIEAVGCSTSNRNVAAVLRDGAQGCSVALHQLTEDKTLNDDAILQLNSSPESFAWHPSDSKHVAVASQTQLAWYDASATGQVEATSTIEFSTTTALPSSWSDPCVRVTMAWSPHQGGHGVSVAHGASLASFDQRSQGVAYQLHQAHNQAIRCIDYNNNHQYQMVTGGDDGFIRYWDIRDTTKPLKAFQHHSHWVWAAKYNSFHENLLVSGSSDGTAVLTNVASLSTQPQRHTDEDGDQDLTEEQLEARHALAKDGKLHTYEEHEDSIYQAVWSLSDPWVFASLSFDGRLSICRVPSDVKYAILL